MLNEIMRLRGFAHNKHLKRDFQRAAFSLCVDFSGFNVVLKLGSSVVSPLSGRYVQGGIFEQNILI